jgi:hypothetical protein
MAGFAGGPDRLHQCLFGRGMWRDRASPADGLLCDKIGERHEFLAGVPGAGSRGLPAGLSDDCEYGDEKCVALGDEGFIRALARVGACSSAT